MTSDRDDLEPALRAMLGDHHLDVRPGADAVDTVLFGIGRACRHCTMAYGAVVTLAVAGVIGTIALVAVVMLRAPGGHGCYG